MEGDSATNRIALRSGLNEGKSIRPPVMSSEGGWEKLCACSIRAPSVSSVIPIIHAQLRIVIGRERPSVSTIAYSLSISASGDYEHALQPPGQE